MASKKFEKCMPEYEIFQKVWTFWQQYGEPEQNDNYWMEVSETCRDICRLYSGENQKLIRGLLVTVVDYLEHKEG